MGVDEAEANILDAAHRVFLRQGTAGARMQEIADEAGVNKSMLHYYFRSKDRLAEAVFLRASKACFDRFDAGLRSDGPFERTVRDMVEANLAMIEEHPYLLGYVVSELHHHPGRWHQLVQRNVPDGGQAIQAKLDAAYEAGEIRQTSVEAFTIDMLSLTLFPPLGAGLARAYLGLDDAAWAAAMDGRVEHLTAFVTRALRPD